MELMVVVAIIGILASVAIPGYRRSVERTYWRQAQDLLITIYNGNRAYFFVNNVYYDPDALGDWRTIFMDNPHIGAPAPINFSVAVIVGPPSTFTATAVRNDGSARSMTINENRALIMAGWPMP